MQACVFSDLRSESAYDGRSDHLFGSIVETFIWNTQILNDIKIPPNEFDIVDMAIFWWKKNMPPSHK